MKLIHVVAMDNHRCIGKDNALAWHIPEDLAHFKELTTGGVVLMGRKTFESIGKALPNRHNIVITKNPNFTADNITTAQSLVEAIALADTIKSQSVSATGEGNAIFVIGGGEIYKQSLEQAAVLELTFVDTDIKGDTFYPEIPANFVQTWQSDKKTDPKSGIGFYFARYEHV